MEGSRSNAGGQNQPTVWVRPLLTIFGLAVLLVLVVVHLDAVTMVLLGVLVAGAVAAVLKPVARLIPGPRGVRAALTELLLAASLVGLGYLLWLGLSSPIQGQLERLPQHQEQLDALLAAWSARLGLVEPITVQSILNQVARWLGDEDITDLLARATEFVTVALIWLAFIFFGSMYMMAEHPARLRRPMLRLLPEPMRPRLAAAFDELEPKLRWWVLGTAISMTVVGLLAGTGFWLIGLEFWLGLALLAAVGEIVPIIGPSVAFLTALLFAAAQGGNAVIGVLIVWAITQATESNLIIPLVMRQVVRLPPVVTVFTVVFWAMALGAAGLLLAVPINLAVWTFVRHLVYSPRDLRQADKGDVKEDTS